MASLDNVLLYYQHPHIQTFVQNNTVRTEVNADVPGPINTLQVIMAGKGKHNTLQYFTNLPAFIEEHGEPNYALYGQPNYNVVETLKSGVAGVYVMRIMPDNATHANVVVVAKYKQVEVEVEVEVDIPDPKDPTKVIKKKEMVKKKKLEVKYESMVLNDATNEEEINLAFSALDKETADAEGYFITPIIGLYVQGKGTYGSRYRAKFVDATAYDDPDNIYKTYRLDIMEVDQALTRKESLYGTLDPDSFDKVNKQSLYIEDIINDPEEGSGKIKMIVNEYGLHKMLEVYNTIADAPIEIREFDPILGKKLDGTIDEIFKFVDGSTKINLTAIDGFAFTGGLDGDFAVGAAAQMLKREKKIEELYIQAYEGKLDKTIKSRYSTPVEYMLDANYPDGVKRALVQLNTARSYNMAYMDTGLLNTVQETINWGETYKNVGGDNIVKDMHHYKIRDIEYTGKTIPMTITHFLAFHLPLHLKTKGLGEPFAMSNAVVRNMVKGSFKPVIDPDENDIKKELYALRINCYETVKANVFQRTTAITSNLQISDLLDEFNMFILNKAVLICEGILKDKLYKLAEPADRVAYQKDADRKLQFELGGLVRSAGVEFKMSPRDEVQNVLRLALRIVYKTIVKRGIVEIYIDPRAVVS